MRPGSSLDLHLHNLIFATCEQLCLHNLIFATCERFTSTQVVQVIRDKAYT